LPCESVRLVSDANRRPNENGLVLLGHFFIFEGKL
jgi:hypothetical protein